MSDKPNNPFQFWQELKRRKVIRVIPVYAAASFVLYEDYSHMGNAIADVIILEL